MDIEWRTLQFFIDEELGTSEVMADALNAKRMRCTCAKFNALAGCKHVKWMKEKMKATDGIFHLMLPPDVPDEEAMEALESTELFRELVLRYGKPEIL